MTEWEYLTKHVEGNDLDETLAAFGKEGWELAGMSQVPHYNFSRLKDYPHLLIFKRPKSAWPSAWPVTDVKPDEPSFLQ
jgi:hypothetical protein